MARVPESSRVRSVGIAALDGQARGTAQRAGQAIEETGRATQRAIAAATKFGTDLRQRRQQAEDGGFTSSVTTKARSRFQEVFLESRNQATEGAEDFAAAFQKRLDQETEALIEVARAAGGRPSGRAIQDTRGRLQLLGAAFTGQAASFENNARIAKLSRDLTGGLDDLTRQAFDDPERRPELLDAADEGIDSAASFLPAADLEALRERALSAITVASVRGVIERDPGLAAEMLEAGDFDAGLEAARKAVFIAGAKTARRLEEEALAREAAADRRELRRDADAAIAKLRGGQPVAEVTALESRAEALEESETHAALRHAEDDQIFMRGFAQRPPAAQAELIAALENGPELKPVETRRLAAMKAQAAATEKALAKDPLAYAQTSGVIEEPADLTDLTPEALRARLRQAEITQEQFGLATLPLLRPGEAEALAKKLAEGTPEDLQAKAEELAELPAEVRQALFDEIAPELPPDARRVFRLTAGLDSEGEPSDPTESVSPPSDGVDADDKDELARQAVAALLRGAPLEAVQRGLRERGVDPAEFGVVPDGRAFDEIFVTEGPEGQVRVFGSKGDKLENLGLFGKRRSAVTRAETLRGLGPDNAFRDLLPAEGELEDDAERLDFSGLKDALDLPVQLFAGVLDGLENTADTLEKLVPLGTFDIQDGRIVHRDVDPDSERALPEIGPPRTVGGSVARGVGQFIVGFVPAFGLLRAFAVGARIAKGAQATGLGAKAAQKVGQLAQIELAVAATEQLAFDPFDERLANLIQEFPELRNPITEYLAADRADTKAEARFKVALNGVAEGALGAAGAGILQGIVKGVRRARLGERVKDFAKSVREASGGKALSRQKLVFGGVTAEEAQRIRKSAKVQQGIDLDVSGFKHSIDGSGVRHVFNKHGDPKKEQLQGQLAVTDDDFGRIPQVIDDWDSLYVSDELTGVGRPAIVYEKTFDKEHFQLVYTVEVRSGRKVLALQTMTKRPVKGTSTGGKR